MHALFHIRTVIITRDQYGPKCFIPRVDICRGMITSLRYFNIEYKRTKLIPTQTHNLLI